MPCVNSYIAGRNKKQYYLDNREDILAKNKIFLKEYRETHKERIKELCKAYYIKHKSAISQQKATYYAEHKEQRKAYLANRKERIKNTAEAPILFTNQLF